MNFINFDNCYTNGESLKEAMINAKDVLEVILFVVIQIMWSFHMFQMTL
ncbi:hypothetical protein Z971_11340 [Enterococcus faecium VRE0576]|nr:hypothetical protein Z971_11340 [Enterococcus faecium VRE0576]